MRNAVPCAIGHGFRCVHRSVNRTTVVIAIGGVALVLLSACSQPIGPVAGGKLDGTQADWPDDWAFTATIENVLIETLPDDPYSVTVWCITDANNFYVGASTRKSRWAQNILENSSVVLSVQGQLYSATATQVRDSGEIEQVLLNYVEKYSVDDPSDFTSEDGILFRLTKR